MKKRISLDLDHKSLHAALIQLITSTGGVSNVEVHMDDGTTLGISDFLRQFTDGKVLHVNGMKFNKINTLSESRAGCVEFHPHESGSHSGTRLLVNFWRQPARAAVIQGDRLYKIEDFMSSMYEQWHSTSPWWQVTRIIRDLQPEKSVAGIRKWLDWPEDVVTADK